MFETEFRNVSSRLFCNFGFCRVGERGYAFLFYPSDFFQTESTIVVSIEKENNWDEILWYVGMCVCSVLALQCGELKIKGGIKQHGLREWVGGASRNKSVGLVIGQLECTSRLLFRWSHSVSFVVPCNRDDILLHQEAYTGYCLPLPWFSSVLIPTPFSTHSNCVLCKANADRPTPKCNLYLPSSHPDFSHASQ